MRVRRIKPDDGPLVRTVRLRALLDSPEAFGSSHEAESMYPAAHWDDTAAEAAGGDERAIWLAVDDQALRAMAGAAVLEGGRPGEHVIWGMWVAPEARCRGVGAQLLRKCVAWSWAAGAEVVNLWVTEGNEPARRLYEGAGFLATGIGQPLRSHPHLTGILLEQRRPEGL